MEARWILGLACIQSSFLWFLGPILALRDPPFPHSWPTCFASSWRHPQALDINRYNTIKASHLLSAVISSEMATWLGQSNEKQYRFSEGSRKEHCLLCEHVRCQRCCLSTRGTSLTKMTVWLRQEEQMEPRDTLCAPVHAGPEAN